MVKVRGSGSIRACCSAERPANKAVPVLCQTARMFPHCSRQTCGNLHGSVGENCLFYWVFLDSASYGTASGRGATGGRVEHRWLAPRFARKRCGSSYRERQPASDFARSDPSQTLPPCRERGRSFPGGVVPSARSFLSPAHLRTAAGCRSPAGHSAAAGSRRSGRGRHRRCGPARSSRNRWCCRSGCPRAARYRRRSVRGFRS